MVFFFFKTEQISYLRVHWKYIGTFSVLCRVEGVLPQKIYTYVLEYNQNLLLNNDVK